MEAVVLIGPMPVYNSSHNAFLINADCSLRSGQ